MRTSEREKPDFVPEHTNQIWKIVIMNISLPPNDWCSWITVSRPSLQVTLHDPKVGGPVPRLCRRVSNGVWWTVHLTYARKYFLSSSTILLQRQYRQVLETADASFQQLA